MHTGVAFDNFNRFVETTDGKQTLHDTVGIIYLDIYESSNNDVQERLLENEPNENQGLQIEIVSNDDQPEQMEKDLSDDEQPQMDSDKKSKPTKRRRTFDTDAPEIEPVTKQLKLIGSLALMDLQEDTIPDNLTEVKKISEIL